MKNDASVIDLPSQGTKAMAKKASNAFVFALLFSLCLTRPTFLGQDYNYVGGFAMILVTVLYLMTRTGVPVVLASRSPTSSTAMALGLFWLYAFGSSVLFGQSDIESLLKACSGGLGVTICFLLLSENGDLTDRVFRAFARLNSALGFSIAITICLIPLVGYATLRVSSYTIGGYEAYAESGNGDILLPFSVVYSTMKEYGIYRFCAIYRESGIAQAFFVWSAIFLMYTRARMLWIVGAILGAALCSATAVAFSVAAAATVHFGFRALRKPKELIILIVMLTALTLAVIYMPGLGLQDKLPGVSATDRTGAMQAALPGASLWQWLVGHGMFYTSAEDSGGFGINAIASIFGYGAIGFILYLATFFTALLRSPSREGTAQYLTLISPLLVTSLVFQPVVEAPLVMALLFYIPPAMRTASRAAEIVGPTVKAEQPIQI